jgi:hypothetical protein
VLTRMPYGRMNDFVCCGVHRELVKLRTFISQDDTEMFRLRAAKGAVVRGRDICMRVCKYEFQ